MIIVGGLSCYLEVHGMTAGFTTLLAMGQYTFHTPTPLRCPLQSGSSTFPTAECTEHQVCCMTSPAASVCPVPVPVLNSLLKGLHVKGQPTSANGAEAHSRMKVHEISEALSNAVRKMQ